MSGLSTIHDDIVKLESNDFKKSDIIIGSIIGSNNTVISSHIPQDLMWLMFETYKNTEELLFLYKEKRMFV